MTYKEALETAIKKFNSAVTLIEANEFVIADMVAKGEPAEAINEARERGERLSDLAEDLEAEIGRVQERALRGVYA
jgi:hypothetical protein